MRKNKLTLDLDRLWGGGGARQGLLAHSLIHSAGIDTVIQHNNYHYIHVHVVIY